MKFVAITKAARHALAFCSAPVLRRFSSGARAQDESLLAQTTTAKAAQQRRTTKPGGRAAALRKVARHRSLHFVAAGAAFLLVAWFFLPVPPPLMTGVCYSTRVLDREGRLLKLALSADEKYRLFTPFHDISPELIAATLLQEDQHFWWHPGVNPIATVRAAGHALLGHGGRGGASTITMQLARLRYRLHTKTATGKLTQMWRALEIERHFTKQQILEDYLNVAPYGGNVEGIGAASLVYFGKPPAKLTPQEAVLLSVLPQSPTRRAPRAGAANSALLSAADRLAARRPAVATGHPSLGRMHESTAPHFVHRVLVGSKATGDVKTTLDCDLQRMIERRVSVYLGANRAAGLHNAAAMLVDTTTMEVLAQVGSANFGDEAISGQVDGTHSRRSPGSTLKPFIYALAMDQGRIHPLTMLTDAPRRFGGYAPENFDGDFAGPIKATDALARSRNVPAVTLAEQLARPTFYEFLKRGGVALPREESFYGLALPLGGGEVTMEEVVRLYCALANGGRLRPLNRTLPHAAPAGGVRLFSPEAAFLTLQMLGQVPRPDLSRLAGDDGIYWKTGTSMGFRDAWSVAVFDHYVLAVWVGNFDGKRNPAFVGRTCAGPLLFRVIDALRLQNHTRPRPLAPPPGANLRTVQFCAVSGQLPCASCQHRITGWFIPGISPITECEVHREILIDQETGLRVAQDDGTRVLRREVYEFWPTDLLALFDRAGLPRRRPPPFAPGASPETTARTGKPPVIFSPATGRTFAIRAGYETTSTMTLQARCESDVARLYWFAGKDFLGSCAPRDALTWRPTPGLYRLVALDDRGRSSSSTVTLRSTEGE